MVLLISLKKFEMGGSTAGHSSGTMSTKKNSTFGKYRGGNVFLMHIARNKEGELQLPMICKLHARPQPHYKDFLERNVQEGYSSEKLILGIENETVYIRTPGTNRYEIKQHPVMSLLDRFKGVVRFRLAMRSIRQRRRAQQIHEELVSVVWSPAALEKRLAMGLTLDEVLDL